MDFLSTRYNVELDLQRREGTGSPGTPEKCHRDARATTTIIRRLPWAISTDSGRPRVLKKNLQKLAGNNQ